MATKIDFSKLSDEDLELLVSGGPAVAKQEQDLSKLSDEELETIAGFERPSGIVGLLKRELPIAGVELAALPTGAAIGGALAGPPGAAIGAIALPAVTGAIARGIEISQRREDVSTLRAIGEIGLEAVLAGIPVKGGRVTAAGVREAGRNFKLAVTSQMADIGVRLRALGGNLSLPQAVTTPIVDLFDNIARSGLFSRSVMRKFDTTNQVALSKAQEGITETIAGNLRGLSDTELGQLFKQTINLGEEAFSAASTAMFSKVDDAVMGPAQRGFEKAFEGATKRREILGPLLVPELPVSPSGLGIVDTTAISEYAIKNRGRFQKSGDFGIQEIGESLFSKMINMPRNMTFGAAQFMRSNLLKEARFIRETGGDPVALKIVSEISVLADQAMEASIKGLKGEPLKLWRSANRFYKHGKATFANDFIQKMVAENKKAAEFIGESIFRSGNVETVKQAKRAIIKTAILKKDRKIAEEGIRALKAGWLDAIFTKHTSEGVLNYRTLIKDLGSTKPRRTAIALLDPEELRALDKFVEIGRATTIRQPGGTGAFLLSQMAALSTIATTSMLAFFVPSVGFGLPLATAGLVLTGPSVLAKMFTNPRLVRTLTEGIKLPAVTERIFEFGALLAAEAGKIGVKAIQEFMKSEENRAKP